MDVKSREANLGPSAKNEDGKILERKRNRKRKRAEERRGKSKLLFPRAF